ncbi:MAG: hypothetical protein K0S38_201 [Candidatus Paceibacter sp.]|jgi:hypothetical protein|nr:hypothetical protein [Candidatus Paceibacter sp.]
MSSPDAPALEDYFRQKMIIPDFGESRKELLERKRREWDMDPEKLQAWMIDVFLTQIHLCSKGVTTMYLQNALPRGVIYNVPSLSAERLTNDPTLQEIARQTSAALLLFDKTDDEVVISFFKKPKGDMSPIDDSSPTNK